MSVEILLGLIQLPWWGYLIELLIVTQLTIFSVTIYLHRCQAHRALELHPIISHFFRFWLWMTSGMETKKFTAIHRKHHARVETDEDPHSPITKGIRKVLFEGTELYREEARNQETLDRYGEGTPNDWLEQNVYTKHSRLGVVSMLIINLVLFGAIGLGMWAMQMITIPFFAAGIINGFGHYWGYRNYEPKDASRNISPIGFFLGGEELHNNHHAFGTSAKFSDKWWEFDIGWLVICILQFFGLAKAKRVVPKPAMCSLKTSIDADTLKALIMYRFKIMARYTREVILPMTREEKKRGSKTSRLLLRRARIVLVRDISIMKASQQLRLANMLENFQSLRVVYEFRIRLQEIWNHSTASKKELIEALQAWCAEAEATGMETLLRFAQCIKTYVPQEAH